MRANALRGRPGLFFEVADAQTYELCSAHYDAIVTNMVLQTMPLTPMLARLRDALAPGGTLVIVDRHHSNTAVDILLRLVTVPVLRWLRLIHTGHLRRPPEVRAAYNERTFALPSRSFDDIQREAAILPGAQVRRHLMNRYMLVWKKPT